MNFKLFFLNLTQLLTFNHLIFTCWDITGSFPKLNSPKIFLVCPNDIDYLRKFILEKFRALQKVWSINDWL